MAGPVIITEPEAPPARSPLAHYLSFGFVGLVVVALLMLLAYGFMRQKAGNAEVGPWDVKERPAPDFTLTTYDGQTIRLSDLRGKVVLINFWASWCPSCREEAPIMEAAWRYWKDKDVVLLGLDYQDPPQDGQAMMREFDMTNPTGPDPGVSVDYGVLGVPETFFITREGMLVKRYVGPMDRETIDKWTRELLDRPAEGASE